MFKQEELETKSPVFKKNKRSKFDIASVQKIIAINYPEEVSADSKKYKKKYRISIKYIQKDGTQHVKTIFFGERKQKDFIEHKKEELRQETLGKIHPGKNVFDKHFYCYHLLNGPRTTMLENYAIMLNKLKVES